MGAQITVLREELAPPEPVNKKPPQTQRARFLPRSFTPPCEADARKDRAAFCVSCAFAIGSDEKFVRSYDGATFCCGEGCMESLRMHERAWLTTEVRRNKEECEEIAAWRDRLAAARQKVVMDKKIEHELNMEFWRFIG